MAEHLQCTNCGAVLLPEDEFCGECGAPRPGSAVPPASVAAAPSPAPQPAPKPAAALPSFIPPPPPSPPAAPSTSAMTGWRVAAIVLLILGGLACLLGLIAFVLFGSMPSESTTVQEDWLFSALCCLLPIGGTGLILAAASAVIWRFRLRGR